MQILYSIYFPHIQTHGLVIESFEKRFMEGIDIGTWRTFVRDEIEKDEQAGRLLRKKVSADLERTVDGNGEVMPALHVEQRLIVSAGTSTKFSARFCLALRPSIV